MKSTIAALAALAFISPAFASAAVVCNQPNHAVWNADSTQIIGCVSDAAWQRSMAEQSSRAANHLPVVPSGTVLKDAAGITYQVPNIVYRPGWYDLTHTAAYEANARLIAEELSGNYGWGYWLNH